MEDNSLSLESRPFIAIFATDPYPVASAAVSTVASFMALVTVIRSKHYKGPLGKMICWLMLGDFLFFLLKVIMGFPYNKSDTICSFAMMPAKFGMSLAFFWSTSFAHAFYSAIRNDDAEAIHKNMKFYLMINTSLSLLLAVVIGTTDFMKFDEESKGCVHFLTKGVIDYLMIFLGQLPLSIVCFLNIIWYLLGICRLRKRFPQGNRRDLFALLLYPTILLACWLPVMGLSLCSSFGIVFNKNLLIYSEILANLQGFLDALAYGGTNHEIRKTFKILGKNCCKKRDKRDKSESSQESLRDITIRRTIKSKISTSPNGNSMETRLL